MHSEYKEALDMSDHLRGLFILKKDGKIIAKGHNLVVNDGRQFIYDKFISALLDSNDSVYAKRNHIFYRFYAGEIQNESFMTLPETTFADVKNHIIKNNNEPDPKFFVDLTKTESTNGSIKYEPTTRMIEIKLNNLQGDSVPHCLSEFFVTTYNPDSTASDKEETLFSRFLIDPIYLVSGSSYSLAYYISI